LFINGFTLDVADGGLTMAAEFERIAERTKQDRCAGGSRQTRSTLVSPHVGKAGPDHSQSNSLC
jgi:hypothetical protein